MSSRPVLRVRKSGAVLVAAGIAFVGTAPLAGSTWALAPLLLIPVVFLLWAWRAGTDVFPDELRVRALAGGTTVPWDRIAELAPDRSGQVSALLDNGNTIRLTGVTRENLPLVLAAAGHAPEKPAETTEAPAEQ
ncbi:PH domain-containing protein [Actinoplanes sp. NPDC051851]|uniref:PH domain-containing protein n=1 Tax=Actinoplanes sp. NPDC051851 TaxID=3154753 RepID=UPI00342E0C82